MHCPALRLHRESSFLGEKSTHPGVLAIGLAHPFNVALGHLLGLRLALLPHVQGELQLVVDDVPAPSECFTVAPMARSNSPTLGHPKFPQAGPSDYDDSGLTAMRAAASFRR